MTNLYSFSSSWFIFSINHTIIFEIGYFVYFIPVIWFIQRGKRSSNILRLNISTKIKNYHHFWWCLRNMIWVWKSMQNVLWINWSSVIIKSIILLSMVHMRPSPINLEQTMHKNISSHSFVNIWNTKNQIFHLMKTHPHLQSVMQWTIFIFYSKGIILSQRNIYYAIRAFWKFQWIEWGKIILWRWAIENCCDIVSTIPCYEIQ